jgi:hypothetical protein
VAEPEVERKVSDEIFSLLFADYLQLVGGVGLAADARAEYFTDAIVQILRDAGLFTRDTAQPEPVRPAAPGDGRSDEPDSEQILTTSTDLGGIDPDEGPLSQVESTEDYDELDPVATIAFERRWMEIFILEDDDRTAPCVIAVDDSNKSTYPSLEAALDAVLSFEDGQSCTGLSERTVADWASRHAEQIPKRGIRIDLDESFWVVLTVEGIPRLVPGALLAHDDDRDLDWHLRGGTVKELWSYGADLDMGMVSDVSYAEFLYRFEDLYFLHCRSGSGPDYWLVGRFDDDEAAMTEAKKFSEIDHYKAMEEFYKDDLTEDED